jgi:hypothetical protein
MRRQSRTGRAAVMVVIVAPVGCAPLASFRPPAAVEPGYSAEFGAGAVALSPRPYVDEPTSLTGQLWVTRPLEPWLHLSAIGAFDDDALAAGFALQAVPVLTRSFAAGAELEAGYGWGALGLPVAWRPTSWFTLYAAPRLGTLGDLITPGIPAGMSVRLHRGFLLRAEGQASWADFDPYNRRVHYGAAGVYQW